MRKGVHSQVNREYIPRIVAGARRGYDAIPAPYCAGPCARAVERFDSAARNDCRYALDEPRAAHPRLLYLHSAVIPSTCCLPLTESSVSTFVPIAQFAESVIKQLRRPINGRLYRHGIIGLFTKISTRSILLAQHCQFSFFLFQCVFLYFPFFIFAKRITPGGVREKMGFPSKTRYRVFR